MASAVTEQTERGRRRTRAVLLIAILLFLLLLCGVLYTLWSTVNLPEHKPVLAQQPGVVVEFQAVSGSFGLVDHPLGVAYDRSNDKIYATEPVAGKVLVFDGDGKNGRLFVQDESRQSTATPAAGISVKSPEGIAVGPDGSVYVADPNKNAVVVFTPKGQKVREMAFAKPIRVTVADNRLYVLLSPGTLVVTDLRGNVVNRFGTQGSGTENLYGPTGVAVDAKRNSYITDSENFRLMALNAALKPIWQNAQPGSSDASMSARAIQLPTGITLGADGNLYVMDGMAGQILVFNRSGSVIAPPLSSNGSADNQLHLPQTIYWMKDDLFVIADQYHNRVVGFRLTPQPLPKK